MSGPDRGAGMAMQYDDDLLYCLRCEKQPDHFLELMAEHVNEVTADGKLITPSDENLYVSGYECPACGSHAEWGHVLRERAEQGTR